MRSRSSNPALYLTTRRKFWQPAKVPALLRRSHTTVKKDVQREREKLAVSSRPVILANRDQFENSGRR
jgi:hypothetical protein